MWLRNIYMDDLFDGKLHGMGDQSSWVIKSTVEDIPKVSYSLYEKGDSYIAKIIAPGVKKEDIDIKVQFLHGLHNIDVCINKNPKEDLGKLVLAGTSFKTESNKSYNIKLSDIEPDTVDATLELGILTITAKKKTQSASITVKVK